MGSIFQSNILDNKVVLISGGASGIGLEIALQLGLHGAKLVLIGRRLEPLQYAQQVFESKGIQSAFVQGDVRNIDDCKKVTAAAVEKFGGIDILVNSAAGNFLATADGMSPNAFRTVLEIDTMGVVNLSHTCFPYLKKSGLEKGDSLIINISATLHYGATYYQSHVSAAKAAIDSLTRSYALEWGIFGIRVIGLAPGPIDDTAGLSKLAGTVSEKQVKEILPLGRLGTKRDVADLAVFVSSKAARNITGDTIVVDGGAWLWRPPAASREQVEQFSRGAEAKSRKIGLPQAKL